MTSPEFFPEFPLPWEMSPAEKFALIGLVQRLRPAVAIEIGTHFGGSLQVLAAHSGVVHAIDLDPTVEANLAPRFPRVRFHTGSSREKIPAVLAEIEAARASLGFVLVDGDHTADGVRGDVEALLRYQPRAPLHIVMHDSFNPDCRRGLRAVNWQGYAHVHAVNLDFVAGGFHATPEGGAFARSMWGGFALAVLQPARRIGSLEIVAGQEAMHQIVFQQSAHRLWHKVGRAIARKVGGPDACS